MVIVIYVTISWFLFVISNLQTILLIVKGSFWNLFNDICYMLKDSLNIDYSIYYYIMTKYDIKKLFSLCIYYEKENFDLIYKFGFRIQ